MKSKIKHGAAALGTAAVMATAGLTGAAPAAAHATCSSHDHWAGITGYAERWRLVSKTSTTCTSDVWYETSTGSWKYGGRVTIKRA